MIGFIFLCLPLFLYDALKEKPNVGDPASFAPAFFLTALLGVAFVFALRVLWPDLPIFSGTVELLYLANSPLVMMGGLYLCMLSALYLYQKLTLKSVLCALSCLLVALIFWMAMAQDVQRAPFVALGLSIILLGVIGMVRAPRRMVGPVLFGSLLTVLIVYAGFDILEKIIHKTTHMGLNMRLQELMAIWEVLSVSWVGLLFGQGWGASFASPAVGNLYVTYSHSLLSYMFFKTGLIGLALTCLFLFEIGKQLFRLFCRNPVLANALFWALIIPVFFYASYKSLDFGLLLTLILLLVGSSRRNKDKVT
ncbi:MAG: hypothetical protein MRY79_07070 [Alphaproteobacteria bacterium]|nr:hypothetical protein [Alphaproteobacteria bacterium]